MNKNNRFNCVLCNKTYASVTSLSNHKRIIHKIRKQDEIKNHTCKYCKKEYSLYKSKWKHEQTCTKKAEEIKTVIEEGIICQTCNKTYSSKSSLINHCRKIHNNTNLKIKNKEDNYYHCQYCNKKYMSIQARWKHNQTCTKKAEEIKTVEEPTVIITPPIKSSKYNKQTIPLAIKRLVWDKYIGECIGKSKCYCCKLTDIVQMSFHCGHVIAEKNGGSIEIANLRPICQSCNSSMGTKNMDVFVKLYKIENKDF